MRQVTQRPISVKMDDYWLQELDREAEISGVKRNRIINIAVELYISMVDTKRRWCCYSDPSIRRKIEGEFFREWLARF